MKQCNHEIYDLIIIGAGPAGYTASIYASQYKTSNLVIGSFAGGMAAEATKIVNFPSWAEISGQELMSKMKAQAEKLGARVLIDEVIEIKKEKGNFSITTRNKGKFNSKAVLLAIGLRRKKLNLKDEDKYIGKGVSYCPTCDGMFYKNKVVAVIGGSDSATTASLYLSKIAKKVYQIYRGSQLRSEAIWNEQVLNNPKIEIIYKTNVIGLKGKNRLEKVLLDNPYQGKKELSVNGLFVETGFVPETALFSKIGIKTNKDGYIITNQDQSTNVKGVWAAGDITTGSNSFAQIITACAEGAIAIQSILTTTKLRKKYESTKIDSEVFLA